MNVIQKIKFSTFVFILTILFFPALSFGQERTENLLMLSALNEPDCETVLQNLGAFTIRLQEEPDAFGYVVVYGGANPIENFNYKRLVKGFFQQRRVGADRYSIITTESDESDKQLRIETWISKDGSKPNLKEREYGYLLIDTNEPIRFGEDSFEITNYDNKLSYYGTGCEICCLNFVSIALLSEFLAANPSLDAHFTIYNKTKKGAYRLTRILLDEAVKDNKIPRNRIKIKYGGKNKWNNAEISKLSDVEVWLIPRVKSTSYRNRQTMRQSKN